MVFETTVTRQRVDELTAAGLWEDVRLGEVVAKTVASTPAKTALIDRRGRLSYGELAALVDDLAVGFLELGVRRGDVVSLQLPNWNEFVALMLALERIGAVVNPVAPIFREREVAGMFRLARPVAVVAPAEFRGFAHVAMMRELQAQVPSLRYVVSVGQSPAADFDLEELAERGRRSSIDRAVLELLAPDPNDVAELIFTSGTTGEPKGVMHTHNTLIAGTRAMIDAQRVGPDDVFHMASTFAHQTGYLFGARLFAQAGGTGVFQDVWDPACFVDLIEAEGITMSCGATPFLTDLLRVPGVEGRDLSSFRIFGCFGAPIPGPVLEDARRRLPVRVMPGWGMTEVSLVTTTHPDDPADKVVSSDGRAMPGMAVRVVDDDGRDVPADTEGDLLCQGCAAFAGYVQGRDFTESYYTADGWFTTGDRARMDPDGFIRITARVKDIIIRGGENVPVKEIEDILVRHPKVRTIALVGVPDERLGEIGCACIVAEGEEAPTMQELQQFLDGEKVTRQFWPERLEVVDDMPTTPSGKIQKFKLREQLSGS